MHLPSPRGPSLGAILCASLIAAAIWSAPTLGIPTPDPVPQSPAPHPDAAVPSPTSGARPSGGGGTVLRPRLPLRSTGPAFSSQPSDRTATPRPAAVVEEAAPPARRAPSPNLPPPLPQAPDTPTRLPMAAGLALAVLAVLSLTLLALTRKLRREVAR